MSLIALLRNLINTHRPRDPRWHPDFDVLARYNTEVSRGVQHTPEWRQRMAGLQERFNAIYRPNLMDQRKGG